MALRPIDAGLRRTLLAEFPMLLEAHPFDSPALTYRAVSVWDHWLYSSGQTRLIDEATAEERASWVEMFRTLNRQLIANTRYVFVDWPDGVVTLGDESSPEDAARRLDPINTTGFTLLLPDLALFYTSGDNDAHTRVTYYIDDMRAKPFDRWVAESGLRYVGEFEDSAKPMGKR